MEDLLLWGTHHSLPLLEMGTVLGNNIDWWNLGKPFLLEWLRFLEPMIGENRQLVTNEPVEFNDQGEPAVSYR